ncbi:hypothetical protein SAMN06297144_1973 [Sphingomonas guangdongensis]|uniref:Uncharacterized protein n=1 Tax=Sphingomonas guangdongensis TaxID=1141890 RepID=A0A285R3C8_9SPHN|nr:hypothetical protein [Sphingomonas guangdongensis]SOB86862.1 hypothetical protein SAMN06297144_1973 [Sphingomonas guangdongensis]
MAVGGLKGFGWILCFAVVAPACYMVSSQVAAERSRVEAVELAIIRARKDIRALETEFDTRANMAQLERWNGDVLALSAPRPEQYMAGEAALASLQLPAAGEQQYAALVVPAGLPEPAAPTTQQALATPAAAATAETAVKAAVTRAVEKTATLGRIQRVAMVDDGLLSDRTIGDLVSSARRETASLR